MLFPRCSELIKSSKNLTRISYIFSLRLSVPNSPLFPFLPLLLTCLQRETAKTSASKPWSTCTILFLSCRSWLGMWKKWKQTKNPLFWFGWGKYSQNPEQSVDNLKHPKDNEIVRLNILGESFLRGRKLHSTNNRSLLIYMYISISLLS